MLACLFVGVYDYGGCGGYFINFLQVVAIQDILDGGFDTHIVLRLERAFAGMTLSTQRLQVIDIMVASEAHCDFMIQMKVGGQFMGTLFAFVFLFITNKFAGL
jgi:hypothetical protein